MTVGLETQRGRLRRLKNEVRPERSCAPEPPDPNQTRSRPAKSSTSTCPRNTKLWMLDRRKCWTYVCCNPGLTGSGKDWKPIVASDFLFCLQLSSWQQIDLKGWQDSWSLGVLPSSSLQMQQQKPIPPSGLDHSGTHQLLVCGWGCGWNLPSCLGLFKCFVTTIGSGWDPGLVLSLPLGAPVHSTDVYPSTVYFFSACMTPNQSQSVLLIKVMPKSRYKFDVETFDALLSRTTVLCPLVSVYQALVRTFVVFLLHHVKLWWQQTWLVRNSN